MHSQIFSFHFVSIKWRKIFFVRILLLPICSKQTYHNYINFLNNTHFFQHSILPEILPLRCRQLKFFYPQLCGRWCYSRACIVRSSWSRSLVFVLGHHSGKLPAPNSSALRVNWGKKLFPESVVNWRMFFVLIVLALVSIWNIWSFKLLFF